MSALTQTILIEGPGKALSDLRVGVAQLLQQVAELEGQQRNGKGEGQDREAKGKATAGGKAKAALTTLSLSCLGIKIESLAVFRLAKNIVFSTLGMLYMYM